MLEDVIEAVSVLTVCTTCSILPLEIASPVKVLPLAIAIPVLLTVAIVDPPDCISKLPLVSDSSFNPPLVSAFILAAIIYPYNITHRCPEGTVTVTPDAKVIGPTDIPFDPVVIV